MTDQKHKPSEKGATRTGMLERAMMIIESFGPDDVSVSPAALARRAGLSKATGHRIINEMLRLGLLEKTVGGVRLGLRLFEIGQLVPAQRTLRRIAVPVMHELRESTKMTVHLAVIDQGEVLYVDILDSRHQEGIPSRIGGRMPAYATAVGKAMLASLPMEEMEASIPEKLRRFGPRTIDDHEVLRKELQISRSHGIAFEQEESAPGVVCVGAPVRGADGALRGGLSVTGRVGHVDFRKVAPLVRSAAGSLARMIELDLLLQRDSAAALLSGTP